jgi:hypothetical protein
MILRVIWLMPFLEVEIPLDDRVPAACRRRGPEGFATEL